MIPTLQLLHDYESRNVTHLVEDGSWPIVWERAKGVYVWDINDKKYLDLTAAFAVASTGHGNTRVIKAAQAQLAKLPHAMGDVHPHALKGELARELSGLTFERWRRKSHGNNCGKTIFCNSGFEAVEAALKTALLATGKKGVIAFEGAYHGLGYGALNATHRKHFHAPFKKQLGRFGHFIHFPQTVSELSYVNKEIDALFKKQAIGALIVEPIQGRAGMRVPPRQFLNTLRRLCNRNKALLILDEIYTGFGRTGKWFACEHDKVIPDIICLGKALTNGFPLSACIGKAETMDRAWSASTGEAIHTSTYLGHPVGCAMALAQIRELKKKKLIPRVKRLGRLLKRLITAHHSPHIKHVGLGLMAGLKLPSDGLAMPIVKEMLQRGYIFLPAGEHGDVITFTPPFTITDNQLGSAVHALHSALA